MVVLVLGRWVWTSRNRLRTAWCSVVADMGAGIDSGHLPNDPGRVIAFPRLANPNPRKWEP